jgi:hypothetical protein
MKFTLFASMAAVAAAQIDLDDHSLPIKVRFNAFVEQFGKTYTTEEAEAAFSAFAKNDAKIRDYNSRGLTYTLGHNEWSDMTEDDFNSQMLGGYVEKPESEKNYDYSLSEIKVTADSKDWVALGAVMPVKN